MPIIEEIKRLHELHQAGGLTDAEFSQAKAALLAGLAQSANTPDRQSHNTSDNTFGSGFSASVNSLRRASRDRWLGGVCGGLARATGLESWIWRLLFVFMAVCFAGIFIYVLAWVFVPLENDIGN